MCSLDEAFKMLTPSVYDSKNERIINSDSDSGAVSIMRKICNCLTRIITCGCFRTKKEDHDPPQQLLRDDTMDPYGSNDDTGHNSIPFETFGEKTFNTFNRTRNSQVNNAYNTVIQRKQYNVRQHNEAKNGKLRASI